MVILSYIFLGALLIFSVFVGIRSLNLRLLKALHILQLEDYDTVRMIRAQIRQINFSNTFGLELVSIFIMLVTLLIVGIYSNRISTPPENFSLELLFGFLSIGFVLWFIGVRKDYSNTKTELESAKKSLVLTDRATRIKSTASLTTALFLCICLFICIAYYLFFFDNLLNPISNRTVYPLSKILPFIWEKSGQIFVYTAICLIVPVSAYILSRLTPVFLTISVLLLSPQEKLIQLRFMRDAKSILKEFNPLVIGITGSYGKTSVKEILAVLLSEKYNVLKPPGSYNTLMGVTRVIREQLRHFHDVFIVEMGAYREGSIEILCRLTEPTHGLITIIGLQHLERFKTQESIQRAKGELIRALPADGVAILNADDPLSCEIGANYAKKALYFSMTGAHHGKDVMSVSNIELSGQGSTFDVIFPDSEVVSISLPLLGRAAIINTVASMTMADSLGVERINMKRALTGIPQVRHRLEAIQREDGVNIIDDAFNSNPIGVAHALEVLSKSTTGKRILITPGMVELGEEEETANKEFGRLATESCDLVILVGAQRVKPIENGLVDAGFTSDKIWIVPSFRAGMVRLEPELKAGDTILIENDLPDQYDNL